MRRMAWMLLAFWPLAGRAGDPALEQVLECMRANIPQTVRIQTFEITAWDRTGGQRSMRGKLFGARENDKVRLMLRIEAPTDLAGASYLIREGDPTDDMYLYLPSVRRVRRITGASIDGQLWGTDLSYNDIKQIQSAFSGANVVREPDELVDGRPVYVLTMTPRPEDATRYKSVRAQIDQKTCVALSVEFSEPAGVRRTVTVKPSDVKQSGKLWYAGQAEISDVRNGTHTRLKIVGLSNEDKLASRYFNPGTFYLGN